MPLILAAFVAGDLAVQQLRSLPPPGVQLLCVLAALALGTLAALGARRARQGPAGARGAVLSLGALAALALGFACTAWAAQLRLVPALAAADEGRELRLQGVVASLPAYADEATRFVVAVDQPDCAGSAVVAACIVLPRLVSLSWYAPSVRVLPAQRWQWTVKLRRPQALMNPAGFDAEAWMLEQGIRGLGSVRSGPGADPPRLLQERVWQAGPLIDRARTWLRERLLQRLQGWRYAGVIVALVMGDQSGIGEADWSLYNRTGISHLVSISGLHITMIAAALAALAGALWRRCPRLLARAGVPVVRALAGTAGALAYCLLAGWGVPAQRTFLMLAVVALALCRRARPPAATTLALAAALVCIWDPWAVLAAGFWLSFGAVACIFLAASGSVAAAAGMRARLSEALRLQASITIGQVPLTLAIFGQISLVAPLANALAIPLVSYLVAPLALLGAGLAALLPPDTGCDAALLGAADWLLQALGRFLLWLTTPAWSSIALPLPPAWTFAAAAAGCAWLLAPAGWPLRAAGACGLLPMLVWPVDAPAAGQLWVTALDVGQGMCVVLETAHGTVVFDTGPRYSPDSDAAGRVLVPYLRARGISEVALLIVSHQDIDHAGGAASLLHALPVRQVWTSIEAGHPLLAGALVGPPCSAGARWDSPDLHLVVLHPPTALYAQPGVSTNARSCVVLARSANAGVLLTGDVPQRQERQLLAYASEAGVDVHVDMLLAPHHGSRSSSSPELIRATAARWVSMQLGYRNHFGHPHAAVVQRYRAAGVAIERSDLGGAVQWRFGARQTTVARWRRDHARYWHNQSPVEP